MKTYEFQGKNADEAIETACRELKLTRDGMEVEILEPGSAGIFGLVGGRKAKIKVIVPEREIRAIEAPEDDGSMGPTPAPEQPTETKPNAEFLEDVDQFIGPDLNPIGPFKKGDKANLPIEITAILKGQGKIREL